MLTNTYITLMKVFIIGATGLIGRHVCAELINAGYTVSGLARTEEKVDELLSMNVIPVRATLNNRDTLLDTINNNDVIIFTASLWEQENEIVEWILEHTNKLIYCSGTAVLSELTLGDWSENTYTEYDTFTPSKFVMSRYELENTVRNKGGIVVRPPAVWADNLPTIHIYGVIDAVKKTKSACYVGEGLNMYSHVHAKDLAELFRLVIERGEPGSVYHSVAGEVANKWIAESIGNKFKVPARSVSIDEAIDIWGKFRALVVFGSSSRTRSPKSRNELGWVPKNVNMLDSALNLYTDTNYF